VAKNKDAADWILKAMVAVAGADREFHDRELGLICQVYEDQSGRAIELAEVERVVSANAASDLFREFAAASPTLGVDTKEEIVRAAYLVLLADDRISGEERKKLKDLAAALDISEIHFGTILEDLAVWLASQKR
jgi:tellurite resistance protein